jgi:ADP-ribose pyrophosphatase
MKMSDSVYLGHSDRGEIEIVQTPELIESARTAAQERLESRGLPQSWAETGVLLDEEYLVVHRDPVRFPDGTLGTYVRVRWADRFGDGVVILPLLDSKIVLIHHFRHATRAWHWEIPRGFGDLSMSAADSAARELAEEIGAQPTRLRPLGQINPDSGMSGNVVHLFLADVAHVATLDRKEGIGKAVQLTVRELNEWIARGQITDGFTLAAVALASAQGYLPSGN